VEILHNAVDLKRIPERSVPLGELPGGVLAFTKTKEHLDVLEGVCAELGVKFSALGRGAGREVATPEQELIRHDIVVATGRSAIEALCAGACVIVGDARGLSGIVSSENYQYHRSFNFGSETFSRPFTHDLIVKEIQKYNAADARAVTQRIRADANLEQLLDKLEAIYYQTLADAGPSVEQTPSDIRELWDTQKNWPPGNLPEWRRHRRALKRIIRRRYYLDRILSGFL
jgi:hypothetical protein